MGRLEKSDLNGFIDWLYFDGWTMARCGEDQALRACKIEAQRKRWLVIYQTDEEAFSVNGREWAAVQKFLFHKRSREKYQNSGFTL